MANIIHPEHEGIEKIEMYRSTEEHRRIERFAQTPLPPSSIPPRTTAHPSAIATVRPKYPYSLSNATPVPHFDISRLPTLPQKAETSPNHPTHSTESGSAQPRTSDLLIERIFHNIENFVSIDEIDTLPPNTQARLYPQARGRADERSVLSETNPLPTSSIQKTPKGGSRKVEVQQSAIMQRSEDIGQTVQPQETAVWRFSDKVRWWLLYPGRLEFLLWIIATLVLIAVTSFFTFVITVNLGLFGLGGTHSVINVQGK